MTIYIGHIFLSFATKCEGFHQPPIVLIILNFKRYVHFKTKCNYPLSSPSLTNLIHPPCTHYYFNLTAVDTLFVYISLLTALAHYGHMEFNGAVSQISFA